MTTTRQKSNKTLEEYFAEMNQKLDDSVANINARMDQLRMDLKEDIKSDLLPRIETNSANIGATNSRVDELETTVRQLQNTLEMQTKSLELIVRGVPPASNESCQQIYRKMSTAVGYNPDSIPIADAFRLGRQSGALPHPPILLRFVSKYDKTAFHKKYFAKKTLNLADLGFAGATARVYVSENLTTNNQQLFGAAMKLKKEGKLTSVSTFHGTVSVKQTQTGNPKKILKPADLDSFLSQ
jgi:hypothetical protein